MTDYRDVARLVDRDGMYTCGAMAATAELAALSGMYHGTYGIWRQERIPYPR